MGKVIERIKLKNFKAFREEQEFNIQGKNILIFGNNGSGKSSLFWALYTFVQSSVKEDEGVQKYFKVFDDSDSDTHQSLRNIFMDEGEDSYIEVIIKDENGNNNSYKISHDTIETNLDSDTTIQELNLASDFINHKLLHNFYNATHRQKINLWPVFERDIFPFLTEGTEAWIDLLKRKTRDVPRQTNGAVIATGTRHREAFEGSLNDFNSQLENLILQIEQNANHFLKKHFFGGQEQIKLELSFDEQFTFDKVRERLWEEENRLRRLNSLKIGLLINIKNEEDDEWQAIYRPQSFLHESMLTRIAIAIRVGALRTRVQTTDFKILLLDDMLISLDMSNRMDVIQMILNEENDPDLIFFDEFQKIILTHDKGFYELIKRRTSPIEWKYYNMFSNEKNHTPPNVTEHRNNIEKAQDYLVEGNLEACGHELRKETETLVDKYLRGLSEASDSGDFKPLTDQLRSVINQVTEEERWRFKRLFIRNDLDIEILHKISTDFENDSNLSREEKGKLKHIKEKIFEFLIRLNQQNIDQEKILIEITDIIKRIMNPASHATLIPLYENELKKAIDGVKRLKDILEREESDELELEEDDE